MKLLRRFMGIKDDEHVASKNDAAVAAEKQLARERAEYRQTVQRVVSGTRIMERGGVLGTWNEAMEIVARDRNA